jgi:hypothetical protein
VVSISLERKKAQEKNDFLKGKKDDSKDKLIQTSLDMRLQKLEEKMEMLLEYSKKSSSYF